MSKGGMCDICGAGPFAVVARHKRHVHKDWQAEHGTATRWTQNGCRCDLCRVAHLERERELRERRAAGESVCPDCGLRSSSSTITRHRNKVHGLVHGLESTYASKGCRCDLCRSAHTKASRARQIARGQRRVGNGVCPDCGETGWVKLDAHRRNRHGVDTTPPHGTPSRYAAKCRCAACTVAASRARKDMRRNALRRSGQPFFACRDCGATYRSEVSWVAHERREHGISHARPAGLSGKQTLCAEVVDDAIKKFVEALARAAKR